MKLKRCLCALALATALFAGCDGDPASTMHNPFIGAWAYEQTEDSALAAGTYEYEFTDVGYSLTYRDPAGTLDLVYAVGTYEWDDTTITMTATKQFGLTVAKPAPMTSTYDFREDILTLTDEGYGPTAYRRRK